MVALSVVPSTLPPFFNYQEDPFYDNAAAILAYGLAGKTMPSGSYYFVPPITLEQKTGYNFIGSGTLDQLRGHSFMQDPDQHATVLIGNHPSGAAYTGPLFNIRSSARLNFAKFGVMGYRQDVAPFEIIPCTAFQHQDVGGINCGLFDYFQVGIYACDKGWTFLPGTHTDWVRVRQGHIGSVNYPYIVAEHQSVDHVVELLLKGNGEAVVWMKRGGRAQFKITGTGNWDSVLRLGDESDGSGPSSNQGCYRCLYWSDGGDNIQNLVQERTSTNPCHVIFEYWEAAGSNIVNPVAKLNANSYIETHRYYPGLAGPDPPATPWGHEVTVW